MYVICHNDPQSAICNTVQYSCMKTLMQYSKASKVFSNCCTIIAVYLTQCLYHHIMWTSMYAICSITVIFYRLRGLPAEIGDMVELRELYLNNNHLRLLPFEMGKLFQLQKLGKRDHI